MKLITSFLIIVGLTANSLFGQNDTLIERAPKVRYVIWFTPSTANIINGIALGLIESTVIHENQKINGLSINVLSPGFFIPAFSSNDKLDNYFEAKNDSLKLDSIFEANEKIDSSRNNYIHNGLVISGIGILTDDINGILISPWCALVDEVNGISINLFCNLTNKLNGISIGFSNESYFAKGLQVGIFNTTFRLKGIQIGLWNKNRKRTLPIINWNFKE